MLVGRRRVVGLGVGVDCMRRVRGAWLIFGWRWRCRLSICV